MVYSVYQEISFGLYQRIWPYSSGTWLYLNYGSTFVEINKLSGVLGKDAHRMFVRWNWSSLSKLGFVEKRRSGKTIFATSSLHQPFWSCCCQKCYTWPWCPSKLCWLCRVCYHWKMFLMLIILQDYLCHFTQNDTYHLSVNYIRVNDLPTGAKPRVGSENRESTVMDLLQCASAKRLTPQWARPVPPRLPLFEGEVPFLHLLCIFIIFFIITCFSLHTNSMLDSKLDHNGIVNSSKNRSIWLPCPQNDINLFSFWLTNNKLTAGVANTWQ